MLLTETQFLSVKHQKSLLWFSEPGDLNTEENTKINPSVSVTHSRQNVFGNAVMLVTINVVWLQYMFQAHYVKHTVTLSALWPHALKCGYQASFISFSFSLGWKSKATASVSILALISAQDDDDVSSFLTVTELSALYTQFWGKYVDVLVVYLKIYLMSPSSTFFLTPPSFFSWVLVWKSS